MSTETAAVTTAVDPQDGRGPGGMWWVAWRQHRPMLLVLAAGTVVLVGTMLGYRSSFESWLRGATGAGYSACISIGDCAGPVFDSMVTWHGWWKRLQIVMVALPALTGALIGVSTFAGDLDRGTSVFANSQSVGRMRWWGCKVTVAIAPLVVSMLIIGVVMQRTSGMFDLFGDGSFELPDFAIVGVLPAVLGVLGLSIGALGSLSVRGALAGVCVTVVSLAMCLIGVEVARPHLLTPTREVSNDLHTARWTAATANGWILELGYLNADGAEVDTPSCDFGGATTIQESDAALTRCFADAGIVNTYRDYLPAVSLNQLRTIVSVICVGLGALFLAAGAFVLRRRAL